MEKVEKELSDNALAIKYSFGGGKSGCRGTVYNNTRFKAKSGHGWIVSQSPTVQHSCKETQLNSEFIERKKDRKAVKTCKEILKGNADRVHQ